MTANKHLNLIFEGESLVVPPCDGRRTIAEAGDVFAYIDSNFRQWGCNMPGRATIETPVSVYEMECNGSFSELFADFGVEIGYLALTQTQIIQFVRHYPGFLKRHGNGTFFLFKAGEEFFIAAVYLFSDGRRGVRIRRFTLERIFRAGKHHRLVVPQMTSVPCLSAQPPLTKAGLRS